MAPTATTLAVLFSLVVYGLFWVAAPAFATLAGSVEATPIVRLLESIRRWWRQVGEARFPNATCLLITADAGGSNGPRVRAWKWHLAKLAAETGLEITVCHYPPGTSKWNKIEHRLFSFISRNWRGRPLTDIRTIVELIAATKTKTGLAVQCAYDPNWYPTGKKISDRDFRSIPLTPHNWHGDWNYTLTAAS